MTSDTTWHYCASAQLNLYVGPMALYVLGYPSICACVCMYAPGWMHSPTGLLSTSSYPHDAIATSCVHLSVSVCCRSVF